MAVAGPLAGTGLPPDPAHYKSWREYGQALADFTAAQSRVQQAVQPQGIQLVHMNTQNPLDPARALQDGLLVFDPTYGIMVSFGGQWLPITPGASLGTTIAVAGVARRATAAASVNVDATGLAVGAGIAPRPVAATTVTVTMSAAVEAFAPVPTAAAVVSILEAVLVMATAVAPVATAAGSVALDTIDIDGGSPSSGTGPNIFDGGTP